MLKLFAKSHTVKNWTKIISTKYNDIEFLGRADDVATILGITSNTEKAKIAEASIEAFGQSIGISSFEDACDKLGISKILPNFDCFNGKKFLAEYQLTIIIKVLNEGWYPNWEDGNENKYFPYFNLKGGFSYCDADYSNTGTNVPSALYLKSEKLAVFCGKKFIHLYKDYYQ